MNHQDPRERRRMKLRASLNDADSAIRGGDFNKSWELLQNVLREFRMVSGLRESERGLLQRLVRSLARMKRESSYDPLDLALEDARKMLKRCD
ncbi:MAG: hypothetical protein HY323_01075 [Betaproteobacteria bacterium]|nr:hypothetical protein [Betaproteobacteria bacterium]